MRRRSAVAVSLLSTALVVAVSWGVASGQDHPVLSLTIALRPGPRIGQTPEDATKAGAPAARAFDQGSPIDVAFTITNDGQAPYRYRDRNYDRSGRMPEYAVEVTDEQGRKLGDPRKLWSGGWVGGGLSGGANLPTGGSFTKHVYLNQWVMPLGAGRYTAIGVYKPMQPAPEAPVGPLRSAPVPFEVRARSEADLRAYIRLLGQELDSSKAECRLQATRYLGFTGSPRALQHLAASLYDDGPNVAFWAQEAFLYQTDREACVQALLAALESRGAASGVTHLLQHYDVPRSRTLAPTAKWLSDPDPKRRAAAASALARYSELGDAALTPLLAALGDQDTGVRQAVAGALCMYRKARATQALLTATHDHDVNVRFKAVWSLGTSHAGAAVPRLQELLHDVPVVAQEAVRSLEAIGTPAAKEALGHGLNLADDRSRMMAAGALLALGDDSVRELLAKALEAADPALREFIHNQLNMAVQKRRIPGPRPDGAWCYDSRGWVTWLRQAHD